MALTFVHFGDDCTLPLDLIAGIEPTTHGAGGYQSIIRTRDGHEYLTRLTIDTIRKALIAAEQRLTGGTTWPSPS